MVEECVDVQVVSQKVTKSHVRRHSYGKTCFENNEENVVPHYRRASIGSCHDLCKYGKRITANEENKRSFIPNLAERKQLLQSWQKNIGDTVVTSGVKLRASTDSEPTSLVKYRESTNSQLQVSNASDTTKVIKTRPSRLVQLDNEVVVNKKKTSMIKVKQLLPLPKSNNSSTNKIGKQEISSTSKMDSTPKPISNRFEASSISIFKKEESLLKSTSQRVKTNPISIPLMAKTSSKSTSKKTRTLSKFSGNNVTSMNLDSSKIASPRASSSLSSSQKRIAGININKILKTASCVKNHLKPRQVEPKEQYNEVAEKTLYVVKIESEDQTFQYDHNKNLDIEMSSNSQISIQEDQEKYDYAISKFEDDCLENNGKENMENLDTFNVEVEENEKPQKDNAIDVKVVAAETVAMTSVEKIVLRHQDVKEKKNEQILLNNMIVETTSKLVETQNGKVKVLVCAFETLMSLNDKKA